MSNEALDEILGQIVRQMDLIWDRLSQSNHRRLAQFTTQFNTGKTIAEVRNFAVILHGADRILQPQDTELGRKSNQMAMALSLEIGAAIRRDPAWQKCIQPLTVRIYKAHRVRPHLATYIYDIPRLFEIGEPVSQTVLRTQDSQAGWPFELTNDDKVRLRKLRISAD